LRDELRVDLGPRHLDGLHLDVPARQLFERLGQLVDLLALLADDRADAATRHTDGDALASALDAGVGDRGTLLLAVLLVRQVLDDELADRIVFEQQFGEVLLAGVPRAPPRPHDAGAKPRRSDFLAHSLCPSGLAGVLLSPSCSVLSLKQLRGRTSA